MEGRCETDATHDIDERLGSGYPSGTKGGIVSRSPRRLSMTHEHNDGRLGASSQQEHNRADPDQSTMPTRANPDQR
jgi:hypothetical protein